MKLLRRKTRVHVQLRCRAMRSRFCSLYNEQAARGKHHWVHMGRLVLQHGLLFLQLLFVLWINRGEKAVHRVLDGASSAQTPGISCGYCSSESDCHGSSLCGWKVCANRKASCNRMVCTIIRLSNRMRMQVIANTSRE